MGNFHQHFETTKKKKKNPGGGGFCLQIVDDLVYRIANELLFSTYLCCYPLGYTKIISQYQWVPVTFEHCEVPRFSPRISLIEMAQSHHISRRKKLNLPYLDHSFQVVARILWQSSKIFYIELYPLHLAKSSFEGSPNSQI